MIARLGGFLLMALSHGCFGLLRWPKIWWDAGNPLACQRRALRRILAANADTRLGRQFDFRHIEEPAAYAERVPPLDYEFLRPYISRQIDTGVPEIVAESPIFFAKTSGTTGDPKYLPVTRSSLSTLRETLGLLSFRQFLSRPSAFTGGVLTLTSGPKEGMLQNGIAYGSASGLAYMQSPRLFARKFLLPPEVLSVDDFELRYLLVLAIGMRRPDTTYIATANPSTLLVLQEHLARHGAQLLDGLEHGRFLDEYTLPHSLSNLLASLLRSNRHNSARLRHQLQLNGRLLLADLWPKARMLATWTGGSCGLALNATLKVLPSGITVMDLGYLSSEFRGTVPLWPADSAGLPSFRENYFEFVEQSAWESGQHCFLGLHQLERNRRYHVFVTTPTGLYRYDMNDILEVTGFFRKTPLLRFIQKGKGVTSITGEKLYEGQMLQAWQDIDQAHAIGAAFFLAVADIQSARYLVYIETPSHSCDIHQLAQNLDRVLSNINAEYRDKRRSGRLNPIEIALLQPGTGQRYRESKVRSGLRDSQFKLVSLCYKELLDYPFDDAVIPHGNPASP